MTLANGILMSHYTGKPVDVPIDADAYEKLLKDLIANSSFEKDQAGNGGPADLGDSF